MATKKKSKKKSKKGRINTLKGIRSRKYKGYIIKKRWVGRKDVDIFVLQGNRLFYQFSAPNRETAKSDIDIVG